MKLPFGLHNNKNYFKTITDTSFIYLNRYLITPSKAIILNINTRYRHSTPFQYALTGLFWILFGYGYANMSTIENREKTFTYTWNKTEYQQLLNEIRGGKKEMMVYESVRDLLEKRHKQGLSSIQILSLNQLVKRPELNVHGEYLASLK